MNGSRRREMCIRDRDKDVRDIQKIIHKCKLNYRLDELPDRIGNVVCKFDIESLNAEPTKVGVYLSLIHI